MSLKWAELIENGKLSALLPTNQDEEKELLSARNREVIDTNEKNINNNVSLSTVEQLLLANYFAIGPYNFQAIIGSLDKYGMEYILRYANHFNKARFILNNNKRSFIVLEDAKESSIKLFSELLTKDKISPFILGLYLNNGYSNREFPFVLTHPTSIYKLNPRCISNIELIEEEELVRYLRICNPTFRAEPNMLYFNENLIDNYAIRLLVTVYKELYLIVDNKTNLVVFVGGRN
ncbi:hypothetical protein GH741_11375 [Aquibacillus halophilus]|uniref:Uncharacterized protein n=1 Tax=Aquibacillus halophilus TaxID=930132 RepID=A0A6A8DDG5_9BACI|nr:hypothetical protein [Aquibacillus halophilus]MRH43280.1 hypothetical protein [Aquibacillus halophilus]